MNKLILICGFVVAVFALILGLLRRREYSVDTSDICDECRLKVYERITDALLNGDDVYYVTYSVAGE
jgi:hypothetical protein